MRRRKAIIALLLFTALTVAVFPSSATAEYVGNRITLTAPETVCRGETVPVAVEALPDSDVSNGKLVFSYDPALLAYLDTEIGGAWTDKDAVVYSVNSESQDGRLILAFTGNLPAGAGVLFTINFFAVSPGNAQLKLSPESYIGHAAGGIPLEGITVTILGGLTGGPTLDKGAITYGQALDTIKLSGNMMSGDRVVEGAFTWKEPDTAPNAGSYDAVWIFTPNDTTLFTAVTGVITIIVNKAVPTGTPGYTAITGPHHTLAEAGLRADNGAFSVPGTVAWELDPSTQVEADTEYVWIFTPADTENYETISGSIVLWVSGEPLEHTWGQWEVKTPATCTDTGERVRTCETCGRTESETLPALGHDYKDGVCTRCGEKTPDLPVPVDPPAYVPESQDVPEWTCDGGEDCPSRRFTDLALTGEVHQAMDYMVSRGLMQGVSQTRMAPDAPMSRGAVVTVLFRAAGSPAISSGIPFIDLRRGSFSEPSVTWAWSRGITIGVSSTSFAPDLTVSREQLATFLYRYALMSGVDPLLRSDISVYPDWKDVSDYALDAMRWAVYDGIIDPSPDGKLQPGSSVTRVQASTMIWRLLDTIGE